MVDRFKLAVENCSTDVVVFDSNYYSKHFCLSVLNLGNLDEVKLSALLLTHQAAIALELIKETNCQLSIDSYYLFEEERIIVSIIQNDQKTPVFMYLTEKDLKK